MATSWQVDGEVILALRLASIERALQRKEPAEALVEAEELLDDHPMHPMGLFYAGQAALQLGAAHTARAAFLRCSARRPMDPALLAPLARAHFECGDLDQALEAADAALQQAQDLASAWYVRGLVLERRGDEAGASQSFTHAETLSPSRYPGPISLSEQRWDRALKQAIRVLPTPIQAFYVQVPVQWQRFPSAEDLCTQTPSLSPMTGALYLGKPPSADQDPWQCLPAAVRLYRGNLRHNAPPGSSLVERISQSLLNEALLWTGAPHEEVMTD